MMGRSVDFMVAPRAPLLGWWLLAAGIVSMLVALEFKARWEEDQLEAQRIAQSRADLQRAQRRPPPTPEPTLAQRRWLQVQPDLQRPWLPMLRAVEAATSRPVYLLALAVEPESGVVTLQAEAPDFGTAVDYAQRLGETGALQPGTLLSHEEVTVPGVPGTTVRFSATTLWIKR